jgi:hypothetical protein
VPKKLTLSGRKGRVQVTLSYQPKKGFCLEKGGCQVYLDIVDIVDLLQTLEFAVKTLLSTNADE